MDEKITILIIGRLNESNSAADDLVLQNWLEKHPNHQAEYEDFKRIWQQSENLEAFPKIDVEEQWRKFQNRHFAKKGKHIKMLVWRYAAAAILILSIGISGLYLSGEKTYKTNKNERLKINLSDGTYIVLKDESTLKVPYSYGWFSRNLDLNGAGFFKVAKNADLPFSVLAAKSKTTVLGTRFELNASTTQNEIHVSEGKVAYYKIGLGDSLILTEGESAQIVKNNLMKIERTAQADESWLTGDFSFENERLLSVLYELQNHYAFSLKLENVEISENCRFTGSFNSQDLKEVLNELEMVMGMEYRFDHDVLTLTKLSCN